MKKFTRLVGVNVIGPQGIVLQSKAESLTGEEDRAARKLIEKEWNRWCKGANASADGRLSFREILRLCIVTIARDGEVLIRKVRNADNEYRFALQLIEPDVLDHRYCETLANGNEVVCGVEVDKFGKPVAYHLTEKSGRVRVLATEIMHVFFVERIGQMRGIPWAHSALARLRMTLGYEEAELIAARISASKMGFITEEIDADADYDVDDEDESGNPISSVEPGTIEKLPAGMDFKSFDPTHPAGNFPSFMKANMRGAASGLCVSYPTLANDLEGVNYSSIRAGLIEDRDIWMELQEMMIERVCEPVFDTWLLFAMLSGRLPITVQDLARMGQAEWQARRWQWVDPLKDVEANIKAVDAAFKSRQQVIREMGNDPEQVYEEIQADDEAIGDFVKGTTSGATAPQQEGKDNASGKNDEGNDGEGSGEAGQEPDPVS
jgi:lambda family phage portal protein